MNIQSSSIEISQIDIDKVSSLLGREPRGLRDIAVRTRHGEPAVIEVASLVDKKPFPTLFWLIDKQLNYAIDRVEATGLIAEFQQVIDDSPELQAAMMADHQAYIALRQSKMSDLDKQQAEELGFADVLQRRGIGGIENFQRIRCLHTYYAAHLVMPNTVGQLLDSHWQAAGVTFTHLP